MSTMGYKNNKPPVTNDKNKYPMRSERCSYKGAKELGIEVSYWRFGTNPDQVISLPRIKTLEKDLPE